MKHNQIIFDVRSVVERHASLDNELDALRQNLIQYIKEAIKLDQSQLSGLIEIRNMVKGVENENMTLTGNLDAFINKKILEKKSVKDFEEIFSLISAIDSYFDSNGEARKKIFSFAPKVIDNQEQAEKIFNSVSISTPDEIGENVFCFLANLIGPDKLSEWLKINITLLSKYFLTEEDVELAADVEEEDYVDVETGNINGVVRIEPDWRKNEYFLTDQETQKRFWKFVSESKTA